MAKAHLILVDGTTVNIEGSAEEVAMLLERFSAPGANTLPSGKRTGVRPVMSFG